MILLTQGRWNDYFRNEVESRTRSLPLPVLYLSTHNAIVTVALSPHRNTMHLSTLSQGILERLHRSATLAGPEAKHDPGEINQVTIPNRAGSLASWQLQPNDSINLLEPGLDPLWLLKPRVRNHGPTAFTILEQPFHRPVIDPTSCANQPGSTLRQKRR